MPRIATVLRFVLGAALVLSVPRSAHSQAGISTLIDPSPRSAGMGGASAAVAWGGLNHWANPALLGSVSGIRYDHDRMQLVPGLADDVFYTRDVVEAGAEGVGVAMSGKPVDHGGARLDLGPRDFERVRGWGVGASLLQLAGHVFPDARRWSERADVSIGVMRKRTQVTYSFAPVDAVESNDWGLLARFMLSDGRDRRCPRSWEAAFGYSDLNGHEDAPLFVGDPFLLETPLPRERRAAAAVRFAAGRGPGRGIWADALSPRVQCVATVEHAWVTQFDHYETTGGGVEVTAMRLLSLRAGYFDDHDGQIENWTYGFGVSLPIAGIAGASYDEGFWPQANDSGLDRVHKRQFSAWLDPLAAWRAVHERERGYAAR